MKKGDIFLVDLSSGFGHEQRGFRPAILVSSFIAGMVVVIPLTTKFESLRFPYTLSIIASSVNSLEQNSVALVFQIKSIDKNFFFSPVLIFFKEPKRVSEGWHIPSTLKEMFIDTKRLLSFSSVSFFLLAYFLFNDAILTAANNFPIFLEQVWHISDTTKTYLLLGILITSAIGGTLAGFLADRFGHKRTLMFILSGYIIILPLVGYLRNFTLFVIATTIMGLWFGSLGAVSRSVMAYVAPKGKHNLSFAYFGLAERASSFIGPIVWGLVVSNLISIGSDRYRIAMFAVTGFIILGLLALSRVHDDRDHAHTLKKDELIHPH